MGLDILIKNGRIMDGTGNPWLPGELGIKNGRITKIKARLDDSAELVIDAAGDVVCPGFIDMHSHSDTYLPLSGEMESYIRQGITTCVTGMCGSSLAPIPPRREEEAKQHFTETFPLFEQVTITWNTYAEYLQEMAKIPCFLNTLYFVGLDMLLFAGQPGSENRPPKTEELTKMKAFLEEAMKAGTFGLSTGLLYPPQAYVKTEDIIELAKVVADYNGLYFSHIRDEGAHLIDAVKECIKIIEKSGCVGGQIAHHKVDGKAYWGASKTTLKLIEEANNRGVSVTCDQYPYNRSMTTLSTLLPPWAHEGGHEELLKRLQDPKVLNRIQQEILTSKGKWENIIQLNGYDRIYLAQTFTGKWKPYEAKSLAEITRIRKGKDEFTTLIEILVDEQAACWMTVEGIGDEDICRIMTSPFQMFGTDGAGIQRDPGQGTVHPRFYGTFPRVLRKYVREEKILPLETAIRKMTAYPAQRLGLQDRGLLREGMWADIVIFNPDTVADRATFERSHEFPDGIPYVIVNGKLVVENDTIHKVFPGKVIRRQN
ncbi:MAG: amidohydrolase family protein [Promethearchaeota archaeon]